jgi:excisionase family DNA binding protein
MQVNGSSDSTSEPHVRSQARPGQRSTPRFMSVGAVARVLGMSEATMYRAVRCGEFPAVRVRNRYVIPVRVLDALEDAAMTTGGTVDAADWTDVQGPV